MSKPHEEVKIKTIGKSVTSVIGGQLLKNILEAEDKLKLKDYVEKYNKKPSEFWMNKIKKALTPKVIVKTERVAKKAKEATAKVENDQIMKLQEQVKEMAALNTQLRTKNDELEKGIQESVERIKKIEESTKKAEPKSQHGARQGGEW